jgi:3-keto-5-aminohexanoate cleavage enzyme
MSTAWNSGPVVVTVAVTGADVTRENNPNLPYTTAEIAEQSIDSAGAGRSCSRTSCSGSAPAATC